MLKTRLQAYIVGLLISTVLMIFWFTARQHYGHGVTAVASDKVVQVKIFLPEGWKINSKAPSSLLLLKQGSIDAIQEFKTETLQKEYFSLPMLSANSQYRLQGTLYYCQDEKSSYCAVHNYEHNIIATPKATTDIIEIFVRR